MAVPKKAPAKGGAKKEQVQVSKSDLIKKFSKHKKLVARTGKEVAPAGYVKDEEVAKILGIKPGVGTTAKARLTSVKLVEQEEQVIFKARFVIQEGEGQGTPVGSDIWLDPNDEEGLEKALKSIVFLLQKLGYETTEDLDFGMIADLAEELTEEKPYCVIYVSCWKAKSGKSKGQIKVGVRVNSPYTPSKDSDEDDDSEDADDEDEDSEEEEDDEEEEEVAPKSKTSKKASSTKASSKTSKKKEEPEEEEDEEDDSDDDEESDDEEDGFDEEDPATWVGYECKAKPKTTKKEATYLVEKWDAKKKLLTIKKGTQTFQISAEEVIDWVGDDE